MFVSLTALSLGIAGFFWVKGATLVLPFAALELGAVGAAFLVYARHATDSERISLSDGRLVVEQDRAGKAARCEFARHAVQIAPLVHRDQLIEVCGEGRSVRVGRHLRSDLRPALAREIRMALKGL